MARGGIPGPTKVVPARPAATTVLARTASRSGGVEILVLRRARMARFAPGSIVFPGGAIDAADATLAERWFGSSNEAPRACAVRELVEEAGLLLSADGVVEAAGLPVGWASPPGVDRLCEIGRWIAPEFLETRFDARFYAAWCLADVRPTPDGTEADAAWWARADEILERHRDGTVLLAWPTFTMLGAIATCQAVEDVLRLRVPQVPPPVPSHVAPRPV